jgi:hypothetical protein
MRRDTEEAREKEREANRRRDRTPEYKLLRQERAKRPENRLKAKEYAARPENKAKIRVYDKEYNLLRYYGLSLKGRRDMWFCQGGLCAICGEPENPEDILHVDHDPASGEPQSETVRVRGLLCRGCNVKLGIVENKVWMTKALKYLSLTKEAI